MIRKIPDPVFGCADECCASEVSYPASDIVWFNGCKTPEHPEHPNCKGVEPGWYCDACWENNPALEIHEGDETLQAAIMNEKQRERDVIDGSLRLVNKRGISVERPRDSRIIVVWDSVDFQMGMKESEEK